MLTRLISSLAGIALLVVVFFLYGQYAFLLNLVISIVAMIAVYEFLSATGKKNNPFVIISSLLFSGGVPCIFLLGKNMALYCAAATFIYVFLLFTHMIVRRGSISYTDVTTTIAFVVLIVAALSTVVLMSHADQVHSLFYIVLMLAAAWTADIGAYLVGTFFGKHKLIPEISPKKTVEGLIGGFIFDVLCLMLIGFLYVTFIRTDIQSVSYLSLAAIGLVGAFLSVIGDLTFSLIKRKFDIKDYGKIMPGHGGILDRIDSLIFVAPAIYILMMIFPVLG